MVSVTKPLRKELFEWHPVLSLMGWYGVITVKDSLAGQQIRLHIAESTSDLFEIRDFIRDHDWLGFDTESSGINCYRPGWRLRTSQWANKEDSYVVPAHYRKFLGWAMRQPVRLIGHNGPHDIRSIDEHLGYSTGVICAGETYIPSHLADPRGKQEGGVGHGLKELACAFVDPTADRWERNLKLAFKQISIPILDEVYKSGPRKGTQKFRKARLSEGYDRIDLYNEAYFTYAAADPLLTIWVWEHFQPVVRDQLELFRFDKRLQDACDILQRRAMLCDVPYTMKLSAAYERKVKKTQAKLRKEFNLDNVNSTVQIEECLRSFNVILTKRTKGGNAFQVSAEVLRGLLKQDSTHWKVKRFINLVLVAKQVAKRRTAYTEAMLREMDANGRVHPSINSQAARTSRMSVSNPALQQLPVKDHQSELDFDVVEEMEEELAV